MGCCKCSGLFLSWKDPQPPVYIDQDGKEYCVFHAPTGEKRSEMSGPILTESEFQRIVEKRIRNAVQSKAEECDLMGTVFPSLFSLSLFKKNGALPRMRFEECEFYGEFVANEITFSGGASFAWAKFHENVVIWRSQFLAEVDFSGATIEKKMHIGHVEFQGIARMHSIKSQNDSIIFTKPAPSSLMNCIFDAADLKSIIFRGVRKWPLKLGLEQHQIPPAGIEDFEQLYRAMKQRAAAEHDQPQVSHWHFREKLMQLKALLNNQRSNELIEVVEDREAKWSVRAWAWLKLLVLPPYKPKLTLTGLYWATSGFGERAVRAGVFLLALVALPFVANSPSGRFLWQFWNWLPGVPGLMSWVHGILDAIDASTAMEYIPFTKDIKGIGWQKVGQGLWQSAIIVQFTLFALAVRNRFRR